MYPEDFSNRLSKLRTQKGVSARDMSLSIGQNPGYINNIETGKTLPSMSNFFYICDYLNITPKEFFDIESNRSEEIRIIENYLPKLSPELLKSLIVIMDKMVDSK